MHQNVQLIYIIAVHNNNMDQEKQGKPKEQGNDIPTQTQTHDENQNKPNQIAPLSRPLIHTEGTSAFSPYLSREHFQPQKQQASQKKLDTIWANQNHEIEETVDFKANCLPLARIRKIMKADEGVSMISSETPVLFAKACEMFITELTMRSWDIVVANKRKTLQKSDIASAISRNDMFDFLVDIVPRENTLENNISMDIPRRGSAPFENVPYYYVPFPVPKPSQDAAGPSYGPPRMLMGRSLIDQPQHNRQLHHPFATQGLPIPKQDEHSSNLPDSDD
jgi:nuclear transcription factor Y gamma